MKRIDVSCSRAGSHNRAAHGPMSLSRPRVSEGVDAVMARSCAGGQASDCPGEAQAGSSDPDCLVADEYSVQPSLGLRHQPPLAGEIAEGRIAQGPQMLPHRVVRRLDQQDRTGAPQGKP
jgi:hypothetical protein